MPEGTKRRNLLFQSIRAGSGRGPRPASRIRGGHANAGGARRAAEEFRGCLRRSRIGRAPTRSAAPPVPRPRPSDKLPDAALIPDRYVPPTPAEEPPQASDVTVLKSGVVDGAGLFAVFRRLHRGADAKA